jgi:endonuclease/exonuclease/phosphatase family metal-dependent hydrolase
VDQVEFTVLTYNAGNGRAKPDRLVAALASMNADLIGLQELSHAQAEAITRQLAAPYPYQAMFPGGFAGKAVLSRFPIRRSEQLYLGPERPDLLCEIDLGIGPLNLIAAHPPPRS